MSGFRSDFGWQVRFAPSIKAIVGPLLMTTADEIIDQKEATDFLVFDARDKRIAARVRRQNVFQHPEWRYQFTVRTRRDSGAETEYSKIVKGFADWMFYGHAIDDDGDLIGKWMLIDLDHFRAHLIIKESRAALRGRWQDVNNGDGTYFRAFDVRAFPSNPAVLVQSNFPIDGQAPQLGFAA
jgi:hypothetical protein